MKTTAELQARLDALKQWQDAEPKDWMPNAELIELIEEILEWRESERLRNLEETYALVKEQEGE